MNKWFEETFLPSLFERVGTSDKGRWLSQKQTGVCCRNMELHSCAVQCDPLECYRHDDYYCKWRGREVWLFYSRKNFCGCIRFGLTEEENAALRAEREAEEKAQKRADHIAFCDDLRRDGDPNPDGRHDFESYLRAELDRLERDVAYLQSLESLTPVRVIRLNEELERISDVKDEIAALVEYKASKAETA